MRPQLWIEDQACQFCCFCFHRSEVSYLKSPSVLLSLSKYYVPVITHSCDTKFKILLTAQMHSNLCSQYMVSNFPFTKTLICMSLRSSGIFRLTDPCGMSVLKNCQEDGFHPHKEPADGCPIYENCSNVYTNSNLRFEIFDLR